MQYQYRLEGAEDTWSPPAPQRSVVYAGLHPGIIVFRYEQINSDGIFSPQPARWPLPSSLHLVALVVYLRCVGTAGLAGYASWRYRARQVASVQRVRMRIATDLHDDIGSGLSQIAILSEVLRRQSAHGPAMALDQIAEVSRDLVDSMSDIVWATDPDHDQVGDLAQRMRQFAGEVLGGSEIEFQLMLDGIEVERKLSRQRASTNVPGIQGVC